MAESSKYVTSKGATRWQVRYRKPDGRDTRKRGFTTRRDADLWASTYAVAASRGEAIDVAAGRATVSHLGEEWLAARSHTRPSGERSVESTWRVHVEPRWGRTQVAKVRPTDVRTWIAELSVKVGPVTVTRAHGILAGILDAAVSDRRITVNPARQAVKLPRRGSTSRHAYLAHAQVAQLATEAGDRGVIIYTLAYSGLRWAELAGLHRRHLDLRRGRVSVEQQAVAVSGVFHMGAPKDHERRSVPLPEFVTAMLVEHCRGMQPDDVVFPADRGGYAKPPGHKTWWDGAVKRCIAAAAKARIEEAGRDEHGEAITAVFPRVTPHDMRHTAASLAIGAGANVKGVQHMLGHASATLTLDTYADLFPDDLDDVAEALNAAATTHLRVVA